MDVLFVILGSAVGGVARYWLSGVVARGVGEAFPWGTLLVNVSGAFGAGVVASLALAGDGAWLASERVWRALVIGFLGSYTTVSSFSLQTLALARNGQLREALGNVAGSLMLCLLAAALGLGVGAAVGAGGR